MSCGMTGLTPARLLFDLNTKNQFKMFEALAASETDI